MPNCWRSACRRITNGSTSAAKSGKVLDKFLDTRLELDRDGVTVELGGGAEMAKVSAEEIGPESCC